MVMLSAVSRTPPPGLMMLPSLSRTFSGGPKEPSALPRKKKISPGQEPEMMSLWPSPSRSANCGPKPTHQPVGTRPSFLPSLNLTPAAYFGCSLVPIFL